MRKIIIDVETDGLDATRIWCAVTKNITTEEIKVWTVASELQKYLRPEDTLIGQNIIGIRCTSIEEAVELENRFSPVARYVDNVSATKPSNRVRTLAKIMGTTARIAQGRLHSFRWRSV